MLGALIGLLAFGPLAFGESACSHGEALVPVSVSMSSVRKKRDLDQGPDMCVDGDLETMCTTLRKAYSSITLDFGEPVEIAKVRVIPNFKHPRMSSARIVIANETVPIGSRANEGFEVEGYDTQLMSISPEFQAVGQYLIIQRDQSVGGRNAALSAIEVIAYCPGSDVPNSPEKPSEGDSSCSGGKALVPDSITMSSRKRAKLGEDKCTDGNKETVCTTKREPYPSITLDFGHPVDIAQVEVAPNRKYPGLSELRIVVSNETAAFGVRAEGFEVEQGSTVRAHGRYLILQRDQSTGGKGGALSIAEVSVFCPQGPYVPGTPGGPWTDEEVLIVKEKVQHMVNFNIAKQLYHWTDDFLPIRDKVYGPYWTPENPKNKQWYVRSFTRADVMQAPTTRKLLQLAFHDCLKNIDANGNHFGGCDGCLNWEGMDFLNEIPVGHMSEAKPGWVSYRAQPIKYKTDNNKLSTTAMALEKIYTDPSWPPGTPKLASSLRSTGKSRADLWQLAANTALEIEMARANWGCTHPATYQQFVVALEGKEKCLWKLQEPVPFQYGRADCVRDMTKATTDYPYEATNKESHSNPFGQGDWVLKDLKRDFDMPARQSIALMAVHGLPPTKHNKQLQFQYRWAGNPFISNNYFRTLASKPQYNLGNGLDLGQPLKQSRAGPLLGDALGRPLRREIQGDFCLPSMRNWWNTSNPDSGPWFFRPMMINGQTDLEEEFQPRVGCFGYNYTTQVYDKKTNGWTEEGCLNATINPESGVQTGGPRWPKWPSGGSFTFYLPYEANFVMNFTVDAENRPRGCNIPDVYFDPEAEDADEIRGNFKKVPLTCGRTSFKLDGEDKTSADIVDEFADDHEVWADAFIKGWQTIQRNGYNDGSLNDGPKSSWLGYSLLPEGSTVEFPLLFTENPGFDVSTYLKV